MFFRQALAAGGSPVGTAKDQTSSGVKFRRPGFGYKTRTKNATEEVSETNLQACQ